jgi:peptidyl-Lys metalloendopeptidase
MHKLFAGFAVFAVGMLGSSAAWSAGLEIALSPSSQDAGNATIHYSLTNQTSSTAHVLRWQTPFDGITSDLFTVERDGMAVDYVGPMYKRAAPQAKDYIELQPGTSRAVEVDLSAVYDMKAGGQYSIRYARDAQSALLEAERAAKAGVAAAAAIDSDTTTLWVDGAPDALDDSDAMKSGGGIFAATNSFVSCSNTRQTQLATARNSAVTYATNAKSYLDAGTQGTRFTWWFGSYTSARYSTVRTHFTNLKSALSSQPYTFDCTCSDSGTYAYVYPTQPYRVYLCGAFWSAPNTGTDSRAGTLVHESSHFNVVAGTDDWAYGQTAAHNLANSNPKHAIDNADSHEYFSENTPARN